VRRKDPFLVDGGCYALWRMYLALLHCLTAEDDGSIDRVFVICLFRRVGLVPAPSFAFVFVRTHANVHVPSDSLLHNSVSPTDPPNHHNCVSGAASSGSPRGLRHEVHWTLLSNQTGKELLSLSDRKGARRPVGSKSTDSRVLAA